MTYNCRHGVKHDVVLLTDTNASALYVHGCSPASPSQTPRRQNIYQPAFCPRS